jgi:hypothetical protein
MSASLNVMDEEPCSGWALVAAATLAQQEGDLETASRLIGAAYDWFDERAEARNSALFWAIKFH